MKKQISAAMAAAVVLSFTAAMPAMAEEPITITLYNSKNEITEYLEDAAEVYAEENNVNIEIYYSNDTVAAHLGARYAASDPYVISMVDAKDVYSVGATYGYDLSGEDWIKDTDYAITVDDKVLGFPVCIEARGLLYNADAIEELTGKSLILLLLKSFRSGRNVSDSGRCGNGSAYRDSETGLVFRRSFPGTGI